MKGKKERCKEVFKATVGSNFITLGKILNLCSISTIFRIYLTIEMVLYIIVTRSNTLLRTFVRFYSDTCSKKQNDGVFSKNELE